MAQCPQLPRTAPPVPTLASTLTPTATSPSPRRPHAPSPGGTGGSRGITLTRSRSSDPLLPRPRRLCYLQTSLGRRGQRSPPRSATAKHRPAPARLQCYPRTAARRTHGGPSTRPQLYDSSSTFGETGAVARRFDKNDLAGTSETHGVSFALPPETVTWPLCLCCLCIFYNQGGATPEFAWDGSGSPRIAPSAPFALEGGLSTEQITPSPAPVKGQAAWAPLGGRVRHQL